MIGLRNVIRYVFQNNISNVTLPLLMVHNTSEVSCVFTVVKAVDTMDADCNKQVVHEACRAHAQVHQRFGLRNNLQPPNAMRRIYHGECSVGWTRVSNVSVSRTTGKRCESILDSYCRKGDATSPL